jgi:hypothetical protein
VQSAVDRASGVQVRAMQKLRDFKVDDPLVKAKPGERHGVRVPLDEPVSRLRPCSIRRC